MSNTEGVHTGIAFLPYFVASYDAYTLSYLFFPIPKWWLHSHNWTYVYRLLFLWMNRLTVTVSTRTDIVWQRSYLFGVLNRDPSYCSIAWDLGKIMSFVLFYILGLVINTFLQSFILFYIISLGFIISCFFFRCQFCMCVMKCASFVTWDSICLSSLESLSIDSFVLLRFNLFFWDTWKNILRMKLDSNRCECAARKCLFYMSDVFFDFWWPLRSSLPGEPKYKYEEICLFCWVGKCSVKITELPVWIFKWMQLS